MKTVRWLALVALLVQGRGASAQEPAAPQVPEARIWLDRGDEPLLQRGDRVRIYYRTAADAFVAIFHIDTDGVVTLLHPRAPGEESFARGERDYRLLFPQSSYWYVDEYPGKGYFFLVASPSPFDLSRFDYAYSERRWDLVRVGQTVYKDPYLAMDDYVALLIPDWETAPYALDFLAYDIGEVHEYPRFLCYDCHGYQSYTVWNPYTYACGSFRVVVWDDPWFYPAYRYQAARVVIAPPRRGLARFEFKERAEGEAWTPLTRRREATPRRSVEYVEPGAARPSGERSAAPRRPSEPAGPGGVRAPGASQGAPGSVRAPARAPVSEGRSPAAPKEGTSPSRRPPEASVTPPRAVPSDGAARPSPRSSGDRPVLQRRPSAAAPTRPPGATTVRPPTTQRPPAVSRPSGEGTRSVVPPRSGGATSRPSSGSRPSTSVRPPSTPSRPPASARPSTGSRSSGSGARAASPPPRRRPGGGDG